MRGQNEAFPVQSVWVAKFPISTVLLLCERDSSEVSITIPARAPCRSPQDVKYALRSIIDVRVSPI